MQDLEAQIKLFEYTFFQLGFNVHIQSKMLRHTHDVAL